MAAWRSCWPVIGVRYLLVPVQAARHVPGVPGRPRRELYYIIGLRNLWLGAAGGGARGAEAMAGAGPVARHGDRSCVSPMRRLAASSTGRLPQVAFRIGCGIGRQWPGGGAVAEGRPEES